MGSEYPKERIQEFLDVAMDLVSQASGCVKEALSKRDKNVETKSSAMSKAVSKLLLTEFGIHHRFESCESVSHHETSNVW